MKKFFFVNVLVVSFAFAANSQDSIKKDTAWKIGGQFVFTFSQASFSDWAAGGENNYSGNSRLRLNGNYIKANIAWENNLDLAYGLSKQQEQGVRKTDDLIELNSKFGLKASKKWYYAVVLNAKTQLDKGYKYSKVDTVPDETVSEFLAPLYFNFAIGADFKPDKYSSVFISPVNMKTTYVKNEDFALRYSIDTGRTSNTEIGAILKLKYEREIVKSVNFLTKMNFFADYKELRGFKDVDADLEALITMRVFKLLSVNLNTHLIWDNDVKVTEPDGEQVAKVQLKEIFGAGITYTF